MCNNFVNFILNLYFIYIIITLYSHNIEFVLLNLKKLYLYITYDKSIVNLSVMYSLH